MSTIPQGRRSHRKSRAGCMQCKRRKVKCDETQPHCRNCHRHGVVCSFAGPMTALSTSPADLAESPRSIISGPESAGSGAASSTAQIPSTEPSRPMINTFPSALAVFDLELLHHYTTSTCYTLSRSPVLQTIWRDQAPQIGFEVPPVLNAILALSALHLSHVDESRRDSCIALAQMHHNNAVKEMVPQVSAMAQENGEALFMFTSLTCMFSCAKPSQAGDFLVLFERGTLSEWARLFRGTTAVIDSGGESLRNGRLAPIFLNGSYLANAHRAPEALELGRPHIWELQEMMRKDCSLNPPVRDIYQGALDELARTLGIALKPGVARRLETADVFRWLLAVSDDYLDLLRQEKPIALIIFAYWCTCIRQIEWMWWMEGLSQRLMSQLLNVMDPKYREWLWWPQDTIDGSLTATPS
ncbi:uncharacterized protein N7511_001676 [Penicillium nucicola]|uniref:uncharacterized protein n=1 Tax=Penicillium nucicola TaxID=1850975 RepID=UPI0025453118|nr:uncharacterized protein N7511_001676 [Penicillium nucicola]KAJ5776665.1 hypothetical protein N7511_001676 [Penicillium nucicola]